MGLSKFLVEEKEIKEATLFLIDPGLRYSFWFICGSSLWTMLFFTSIPPPSISLKFGSVIVQICFVLSPVGELNVKEETAKWMWL